MKRSIEPRRASVFTVAALGVLFSSPSHAYLDPGTGSILLQGLLAGLAVGIGVLRRYWQQFKSFLAKPRAESNDNKNEEASDFEQTSNIRSKS